MRRFQKKMFKRKQMHAAMLYIALLLMHVLESVIHLVERYVAGAGRPSLSSEKPKKTFFNVSMIILLTDKCVLKVIDEAHPKNTQIYFITARWKSA